MLQQCKITSYAIIVALVLVLPSQAVAMCDSAYSEDACAAEAQKQGLQLGGGGYPFAGAFGTKGCYSYTSGGYKGMAFYGTGGTQSAMQSSDPRDVPPPKYRIDTSGFCNNEDMSGAHHDGTPGMSEGTSDDTAAEVADLKARIAQLEGELSAVQDVTPLK